MNMPILPNEYIDPELQDLVGSSFMAEVANSLRPTPELIIDQDPLAELPFETEDPPREIRFEKVQTDIDIRKKSDTAIMEKRSVEKPTLIVHGSRHEPYLRGVVDSMRHRPVFKAIKNSEIWNDLVESCTDYVEGHLAEVK
jgi:hypothetical protein